MGAQAYAALAAARAGARLGQVAPDGPWDGTLRLALPVTWDLAATALRHGGVGLAPLGWDGARLHLRLPTGAVRVGPDLAVDWRGAAPDAAALRRVLGLDDDPAGLWAACDAVPALAGLRPRVLRAPSVWQDLVGALASTRASYRSTQGMLDALVGTGAFPEPQQVLAADLSRWGYRSDALRALAERVLAGWDPEHLLDPALEDAQVLDGLRALAGFGPFSAAQLQPLLGRPRPLVLDGWLGERLAGVDLAPLEAMGRWAGTGAWLLATA